MDMSTIAFLVGAVVGVYIRRILDPAPVKLQVAGDYLDRRRVLACAIVGNFVIGVVTGGAFAHSQRDPVALAISVGLSCLLLTYCLTGSPTVYLVRGQRNRATTDLALVNTVLGFSCATVGVTVGAISL